LGASQAQKLNCASFWRVTAGANHAVNAPCTVFPTFPQQVGGVNLTIAFTDAWKARQTNNLAVALPTLSESLENSISFYGTFSRLPSDIVVILTDRNEPYTAETWYPVGKTGACQIVAMQRFSRDMNGNIPRALQALAHEVYHCRSKARPTT
jgi:hypothetical protein